MQRTRIVLARDRSPHGVVVHVLDPETGAFLAEVEIRGAATKAPARSSWTVTVRTWAKTT